MADRKNRRTHDDTTPTTADTAADTDQDAAAPPADGHLGYPAQVGAPAPAAPADE